MENSNYASKINNFDQNHEYGEFMKGLERSKFDKSQIISLIDNGVNTIAEFGCGNGVVLELLSKSFAKSEIHGIDVDEVMCQACTDRQLANVRIWCKNITDEKGIFPDNYLDVVVFCSTLHEIYSYEGEREVYKTLSDVFTQIKPGGNLIIRDSIRPEPQNVKILFNDNNIKKQFHRFAQEYKARDIKFKKDFDGYKLKIDDCYEFMTKYFYDIGWDKEMEEVYGYFTVNRYQEILENIGYEVKMINSYLLPFLKEKWQKDLKLDCDLPDSTVLIKAIKPIK